MFLSDDKIQLSYFKGDKLRKSQKIFAIRVIHKSLNAVHSDSCITPIATILSTTFKFKLPLKNIIAVKEIETCKECPSFAIYYIKHSQHRVLKLENIILRVKSTEEAAYFHILVDDIIKAFPRPRRLMVFINPISGRKKGLKIYREHMAPLCKLCGIECDVIVTNRRGQALEILSSYDLNTVDGIVTVGGDGIFSECVNGLMRRFQRKNNINIHDINSQLVPCDLPIGMIPAGSGNVLIEFLHGNKDIQTAVLRIILGGVTRTNVAGVHQDNALSVYACLVLGFGLCGRMVKDCEKTRWMGPSRYSVAPLKSLLTRKMYDVEVSPVMLENDKLVKKQRIVTRTQSYDFNIADDTSNNTGHLHVGRSKSLGNNRFQTTFTSARRGRRSLNRVTSVSPNVVNSSSSKQNGSAITKTCNGVTMSNHRRSVTSIKSSKQRNIITPSNGVSNLHRHYNAFECQENQPTSHDEERSTHILRDRVYSVDTWIPTLMDVDDRCLPMFGDTKLTAYSVRSCSFSDHLKHLLKVKSRVAYCFKFDFVHALRGRGYRVRIFPDDVTRRRNKYYLNYDGDALLLKSTEFEVRLHRNIVKLFGTIEEKDNFNPGVR